MNYFVAIPSIVGLYFILNTWHELRTSVAFRILDVQFSWFTVLFMLGSALIAKICWRK